jgi:hypothetical protein
MVREAFGDAAMIEEGPDGLGYRQGHGDGIPPGNALWGIALGDRLGNDNHLSYHAYNLNGCYRPGPRDGRV